MASETSVIGPDGALDGTNAPTKPSAARTIAIAVRCRPTAPFVRKVSRRPLFSPMLFLTVALAVLSPGLASHAQTKVPSDVQPLCAVPKGVFQEWFGNKAITPNGFVVAPDNLVFHDNPQPPPTTAACEHYQFYWSSIHMFLWLTSSIRSAQGTRIPVLDSSIFYQVGSPDSTGQRMLRRNDPDDRHRLKRATVTINQNGPEGKPVFFDANGDMHDVVLPDVTPSGGRPAVGATAVAQREGNAQSSTTNCYGAPIVNAGTQSRSAVLMTQTGKLVYYTIEVNDVYAYLRSVSSSCEFPTELDDLRPLVKAHGGDFPDQGALAVALKMAWVETTGLIDPDDYITTEARIPTFEMSKDDPNRHWVRHGSTKARLGLVGMHVVFSAKNNREMIWATFEHVKNAPNSAYRYVKVDGTMSPSQPDDPCRAWLFFPKCSQQVMTDKQRMYFNGKDIYSVDNSTTIGPNSVARMMPWGFPADATNASENSAGCNPSELIIFRLIECGRSEIISVNRSVLDELRDGDVRKNYIMVGTTWTEPQNPRGNVTGSPKLANATMETFFQNAKHGCFNCHSGSPHNNHTVNESHIYNRLAPLSLPK